MVFETRSARARGGSPALRHSRDASERATPRVALADNSPPIRSRSTNVTAVRPRLHEMPSSHSSRETSAPGQPQPPAASSRRAGIDPAPYDLPRNDLGEGQRGRVHPSSQHSSRGDARSPPDDILLRMTQAIEHYERATYLAAAHTYVPSVPLPVAPPIAPPVIQAPPRFHGPQRPVSPYSDPYDHHYPDYYDSRDYLDR